MAAATAAKATPQLTPAMRQYQQFKQQYPGFVLFFRMGDFYELFDDDADTAVRVLRVAVYNLGRMGDKAWRVPGETFRVGVPQHLIELAMRQMIAAGHKVAICEQVDGSDAAKGGVQQEVKRLIEPDGSGANNERHRCEMAAATATKAKKSGGTKAPAAKAKKPSAAAEQPKLPTSGAADGQSISVALTAEDRKALAEVLPRIKRMLDSVTMSTICGNDVAAAAVAKLIAAVE